MNHPEASSAQTIAPDRRLRLMACLMLVAVVFAAAVLAFEPDAFAQDGTGAATPEPPTNCIPPRVTVIADQQENTSPLVPFIPASPEATPQASPEASPVASPVAGTSNGTPRSSLEVDITETTRVLANCLTENKHDTVASLTGDTFRGQLLGANQDVDAPTYIALAGTLTPLRYGIVSIEDIRGTGRGTAEAVVSYTISHQVRTATWHFQLVIDGSTRKWIVTSEELQESRAPGGTPEIAVEMNDNAFTISPNSVKGGTITLNGTNSDDTDHEMLVIKLDAGVKSDLLLTSPGPELPEGIELIGQLTIPTGSSGALVLANLQPGTYTIVCLLPDEEGVPHLASGMQTTFRIT